METRQNTNFRTPNDIIKVRCPNCHKAYSVEARQIQVSRPQFECLSCHRLFAFSYPLPSGVRTAHAEIVDRPVMPREELEQEYTSNVRLIPAAVVQPALVKSAHDELELRKNLRARQGYRGEETKHTIECPKCHKQNKVGQAECVSCGVIIEKFLEAQREDRVEGEIRFRGKHELLALWQKVITQYENPTVHDEFIHACFQEECLSFAFYQYSRILAAHPTEDIAKSSQLKIVAVASSAFEKAPSFDFGFRLPKVSSMVIFVAAFVAVAGYFIPGMRNLTGFGVIAVGAVLALRALLSRLSNASL